VGAGVIREKLEVTILALLVFC